MKGENEGSEKNIRETVKVAECAYDPRLTENRVPVTRSIASVWLAQWRLRHPAGPGGSAGLPHSQFQIPMPHRSFDDHGHGHDVLILI